MGDRCALRQTTLYYGWLLPMSIIILHNLVVFAMVLRVLNRKQLGGTHFVQLFLLTYLFIYLFTYLLYL